MSHIPTDTSPAAREYLIRKQGAWYRPNSAGYTGSAIQAGRYTLSQAEAITHPNGKDGPRDGMYYVHQSDVRCDDLAAYRTLSAERDRLAAQVVQLQRELDAANARAVRVNPLVWKNHPAGFIAAPPTGQAYIIDIRVKGRVIFLKGMNPSPQFDNLEAAKAAAQADYETRIMSALEKPHD